MENEKRNLIIAVALVAIFFLLIGRNLIFKKKAPSASSSAGSAQTASIGSVSALTNIRESQAIWEAQLARWDLDWKRDPFMPAGSSAGASIPLSLTGIVWDEKMPIAMVNDRVLRNGDEIDGYKVVQIKPSSVVLSSGQETFELPLFTSSVPSIQKPEKT